MTSSCVYTMLQAAILAYLHIAVTNGLECYCDICHETDYKCVTDGYCFTSISMDRNTRSTELQYRCLNKAKFFPPEFPVHCTRRPTAVYAMICCNDTDMCNRDEVPSLATPTSTSPLPAGKVTPPYSTTSMTR